ncbi:hypothetical protein G6L30_08170 [Agrobacterium rhizogenes]|nr:hypothetical protein [Rhizobium rhizogenes]
MELVVFTQATAKEDAVYINPAHVAAVRRSTDKATLIILIAAGADGQLAHISVRESPEEVVAKLTGE